MLIFLLFTIFVHPNSQFEGLEVVELLHGFLFDLVTHVNVWLHSLVVIMSRPLHYYLWRDSHTECIADERATARMGSDKLILRLYFIEALVASVVGNTYRLVESCQLA